VARPLIAGAAVRALLAVGDTLWIGSDAGLLALAPGDSAPRRPAALSGEPRLRRPIAALASADSELVVVAGDQLLRLSLTTGAPLSPPGPPDVSLLRGVRGAAMDERTIWLAGPAGVVAIGRRDGVMRTYLAPGELPAEAYDVALDPRFAWIATRAGVVRMARLPDGFAR
jgi:hypothetical protein